MKRFLVVLALMLSLAPVNGLAQVQIYLSNNTLLDGIDDPTDFKRLPVIFVHGHGGDYEANWQMPGTVGFFPGISFKDALDLQQNQDLGIETYYIQFSDQDRSIIEDAQEIGENQCVGSSRGCNERF